MKNAVITYVEGGVWTSPGLILWIESALTNFFEDTDICITYPDSENVPEELQRYRDVRFIPSKCRGNTALSRRWMAYYNFSFTEIYRRYLFSDSRDVIYI